MDISWTFPRNVPTQGKPPPINASKQCLPHTFATTLVRVETHTSWWRHENVGKLVLTIPGRCSATPFEQATRKADHVGFLRTLLGRKCRFDSWEPRAFGIHKALPLWEAEKEYGRDLKRAWTYKALNRLIQGSSADMTKKAMVDLYEEGIIAHIQVHDELNCSIDSDGEKNKIKEIMENTVELKVPLKVDAEIGPSWGEIKKK